MATRQANAPGELAFLIVAVILFFSTVYAVHKLLSPRDVFGLHNKKISRLEFLRSWAGLITVVGATLRFRGPSRVIGDLIFHVIEPLALGTISLFACIIVAVMIASPRSQLIARIRRPLLKIALTFVPLLVGNALGHVPMVTHLLNMKHSPQAALVLSIAGRSFSWSSGCSYLGFRHSVTRLATFIAPVKYTQYSPLLLQ